MAMKTMENKCFLEKKCILSGKRPRFKSQFVMSAVVSAVVADSETQLTFHNSSQGL